jgi:ADP-ribose pyrophosphatase
MPFTYNYARPALTVDCVVFGLDGSDLKVLLIKRADEPFKGQWAIPGGFVNVGESTDDAARRELEEETGVRDVFLEQLRTFSEPMRDPRDHVISVAHYALVNLNEHPAKAGSDAREAEWFKIDELPKLAFDHDTIMATAIERLRGKISYQPIGFELLPPIFTLKRIQDLYETILGVELDDSNFRKKILATGVLREVRRKGVRVFGSRIGRPGMLYAFDRAKYEALKARGFNFEIREQLQRHHRQQKS